MTAAEEHTATRWREAADDLGFKFISPFTLEDRGETLSYLGWLPQFGSEQGILIVTTEDSALRNRQLFVADARGYAVSGMFAGFSPYDRNGTIKVLTDWCWSSSETPPSWYVEAVHENDEV
jgi:hypothetical protein